MQDQMWIAKDFVVGHLVPVQKECLHNKYYVILRAASLTFKLHETHSWNNASIYYKSLHHFFFAITVTKNFQDA